MKQIIIIGFIFLFLFSSCNSETIIEETQNTLQTSCPRGEINCEYPGKCPLYGDQNNNRVCDNSES